MSASAEFLKDLFTQGRVALREQPEPTISDPAALEVMEIAFTNYRYTISGPLLDLDPVKALEAASFLQDACWYLLNRSEPAERLTQSPLLRCPKPSAAQHFSVDLLLRYLPTIHRRAAVQTPPDQIVGSLAAVLLCWPLSGVLSDVVDAPTTPPTFDNHPGLRFLYAERWMKHQKPRWLPTGAGMEALELLWSRLGKDPQSLTALRAQQATLAVT